MSSTKQSQPLSFFQHQPFHDCFGDYRTEAELERIISGSLYKYQALLPKLPVPDLSETCNKYLKTVEPLVSKEDFRRTQRVRSLGMRKFTIFCYLETTGFLFNITLYCYSFLEGDF